MRICFFGTYTLEEGYPVNRTIIHGLRAVGAEVKECHYNLWALPRSRWKTRGWFWSPIFWLRTIRAYLGLIFQFLKVGGYDILIVGYLGHHDIFLAYLLNLSKRKPLVLIAFNSLYETVVTDRGMFSKHHPVSVFLHWLDRNACRIADLVILDTQAHIDYFVREFALDSSKFLRVFVGSSLAVAKNPSAGLPNSNLGIEVLFVGTYIPLHGVETVVSAAKILESEPDVHFILIGEGQLLKKVKQMAREMKISRVKFIEDWISPNELLSYMATAQISLGIFGKGLKATHVIPCKAYDSLAMGKPLITADTPAARELLKDGEDVILCPAGDAESLAQSILKLKKDHDLRERIARNGYSTYIRSCSPSVIGTSLLHAFQGQNK